MLFFSKKISKKSVGVRNKYQFTYYTVWKKGKTQHYTSLRIFKVGNTKLIWYLSKVFTCLINAPFCTAQAFKLKYAMWRFKQINLLPDATQFLYHCHYFIQH